MKKKAYQGFLKKYHNVYLFISILIACGFFMGIMLSKIIDVNDIKSLAGYLTTMDSTSDTYELFVSQFFNGIMFIVFVFLLGTSLAGIPIISLIVFSKGMQIGFSCALFVYSYHLKGIAGIVLTLFPQVLMDLLATYLICASAIQLSMYIIYSTTNRHRLNFKQLFNSILNDIFICFMIVLAGSYLKSTLVIQLIKLFNLM